MKTLSFKSFTGEILATIQTSDELDFIYQENVMLLESAGIRSMKFELFLMKNNEAFNITATIFQMIDKILDFDSSAKVRTYPVLDKGFYQDSLFISVLSFGR